MVSFSGDRVYPKGIISLQITAGTHLAQVTREVDFLIVDCHSSYNVILGRPALNRLKAATSTYCLKLKFPTQDWRNKWRPTLSQGMLPSGPSIQAHGEVENIELVEGDSSKTTKVGKELQNSLKDKLVKLLKRNLDVFAWSHEDMLGIDERVIEHCLNVDPMKKPVQ